MMEVLTMYKSGFSIDIENMVAQLRSSGLKVVYIDYFLHDFDGYCFDRYPDASLLSKEISESWIHDMKSESRCHYARRVRTMKHLGEYQQSIGKNAYVPNYSVWYKTKDEPRLFSDEQLQQFFASVDSGVKTTNIFPHNDLIFPCFFRMQYCCGMRSSEVCNLTVDDVDLSGGTVSIYRSKGFMDRRIYMSDDLLSLCQDFDRYYSSVLPGRQYFFQPSNQKLCYNSGNIVRVFDSVLKKAGLLDVKGKKFTPHGLRHLFAVQNIKKCVEAGEDFANWIEYLCQYMGHKHIKYTLYYLHITSQLFPVYQDKLRQLEEGIGVKYAEE